MNMLNYNAVYSILIPDESYKLNLFIIVLFKNKI